jgi:RHS repeat-associated protein
VSYLHNALEQRVVKTGPNALVSQGAVYYAYDEAGHLVGEYDANLVPIYETAYLGDVPVAVVKQDRSNPANVQTNVANVYTDQVGAPRVITRATDNAVLWRWDQAEAFGVTPPDQNPTGLGVFTFNQRFPGQVFDAEANTFYNWHRNYRPDTGRYAQSDSIGLNGGLNTYAYVGGNPQTWSDPNGKNPILILMGLGLALNELATGDVTMPFGGLGTKATAITKAIEEGIESGAYCAAKGGASVLKDGAKLPTNKALDAALEHLGPGYKEIAPGVFKSADGTRMVRMTESDLAKSGNHAGAPHINVETGQTVIKPNGKEQFISKDNKHIFLPEER